MRRTILMLAALACAAVGAFTAPVYTNRYVSNGVTYSQFGGVKASNYVATAISDVALVGGYTGTVKRAKYAAEAGFATNAVTSAKATNLVDASGATWDFRAITNEARKISQAAAGVLSQQLVDGTVQPAYSQHAEHANNADNAAYAGALTDGQNNYTAESIAVMASNGVMRALGVDKWVYAVDGVTYTDSEWRRKHEDGNGYLFWGTVNFIWGVDIVEFTGWFVEDGSGTVPLGITGNPPDYTIPSYASDRNLDSVTYQFYDETVYACRGSALVGAIAFTNELSNLFNELSAFFSKTGGVIAAADGGRTSVRINGSFMQGCTTAQAIGACAHAEGTNVVAYGEHSHAEGRESRVEPNAPFSHAEGYGTRAGLDTATGIGARGSHAEGWRTRASGRGSHSDGTFSVASNDVSYVWSGDADRSAESEWYGSHGEGTFNINPADGIYGFYIGESTLASLLPNTANFATRQEVTAVDTKVGNWESYWDGTNVQFEVTNYYGNTTGEIPRLRIRELRDGVWTIVWDEARKFEVCYTGILHQVAMTNAELAARLMSNVAPRAWGTYTDKGVTNVAGNCVWMTSPETYFAGGTEYQRVAVGSGAVCVLTANGAAAHTMGEHGTFRFQDEGGTNYFGFAKSESYTIGCDTDGISVENGLVTLRYDVIMGNGDVPIVYWRLALDSGSWVQLNNADGTACDGAPYSVTWFTENGSHYAAINCGDNPSGFFKAETSVAGDVVFETNMKVRLDGGIACTNTATYSVGVIRPSFNGTTVQWTWSAK